VPAGGDPFFAGLQDVYDEIGAGMPPGSTMPRPGQLPDGIAEIGDSGLFEDVTARVFDWEISYTADEYIRLLDTFSGHIAMAGWQRDRLYGEIRRRLAERPDGRLRRHWGAVLRVARRRDEVKPVPRGADPQRIALKRADPRAASGRAYAGQSQSTGPRTGRSSAPPGGG
jgi:hypothetical protein